MFMVSPQSVKSNFDNKLTHACIFFLLPGGERSLESVCVLYGAEDGFEEAEEVGGC